MRRAKRLPDFYAQPVEPRSSAGPTGASLRAFALGTALCILIAVGTIYCNLIVKGSFLAWAFSTPAALFLLFYLVLGNALVRAVGRNLALNSQELTLIYVMMIVGASLPTFGLVSHLLPMITNVFYYARPENNWEQLVQPHVVEWLAPRGKEVIEGFYEGLPREQGPIPWAAWIDPLSYWLVFLLALYLVSTCMMVMVRKPWIEQERLQYPLMQASLALVEDPSREGLNVPAVLRNRLTWIGFIVPAVVISCKALHGYFPSFPTFSLQYNLAAFGGSVYFYFSISFSLLGFSYFISRGLSLGIWVFYLLTQLQLGLFATAGVKSSAEIGWFSNPQAPYLNFQSLGAMLMFASLPLWRARRHFGDVLRKALGGGDDVFDGDEILSYRGATVGLVGGVAVMAVWLEASGVPALVIPPFLLVALLILVALTRIVVEAGVALLRAPVIAPDLMIAALGVGRLGPRGLTALAYTYPWTADLVTFPMASIANGLKMAQEVIKGSRRALFWAIFAAIFASLISAAWIFIHLAYRYGGINLPLWWFSHSSRTGLDYIIRAINNPSTIGAAEYTFAAFGAGLMWLLINVQQRVVWWPLHPLGLAISGISFTTGTLWFNVFLAWFIKSIVLKYGGGRLYGQTRYFFIGMIIGSFVASGTWLFIDYLAGTVGNLEGNML